MKVALEALENYRDSIMGASSSIRAYRKGKTIHSPSIAPWMKSLIADMQVATSNSAALEVWHTDDAPKSGPFWGRPNMRKQIEAMKRPRGPLGAFTVITHADGTRTGVLLVGPNADSQTLHSAETIAHEYAHFAQTTIFDQIPVEDRFEIIAAYATWLADKPDNAARPEWLDRSTYSSQKASVRRYTIMGRDFFDSMDKQSDQPSPASWEINGHHRAYGRSFEEWFAEMGARAITSSPVGIKTLDTFFGRIARAWRAVAATLRQNGYNVPSIQSFFDGTDMRGKDVNLRSAKGNQDYESADYFASPDDAPADTQGEDTLDQPIRSGPDLSANADTDRDGDTASDTDQDADSYSPAFEDVSVTKGLSAHEQAWVDAGLTPDEGVNLPPLEKVKTLRDLLASTFGFAKVDWVKNLAPVTAVQQLLDAHRNMRAMLHALDLPINALGFGKTLSLSLAKANRRWLGLYNGATRTIHLPGRTNSFAHEWGHALDHFLRDQLSPWADSHLLTKATRNAGLDGAALPNTLEAAFVNLLNKMFFDEAGLAAKVLDLEAKASAVDANGNPTKAAVTAQAHLERITKGNSHLRLLPSAYRAGAVAFDGGKPGYFASVHEMFARAFEAYVAYQMAAKGLKGNAAVTKGNDAYLDMADQRLAATFPKASDRAAIFDAFDQVFDHIRSQALLGQGPSASAPTDAHDFNPGHWANYLLGQPSEDTLRAGFRRDLSGLTGLIRGILTSPLGTLKNTVSGAAAMTGLQGEGLAQGWKSVRDMGAYAVNSNRYILKRLIARAPKEAQAFMDFVLTRTMTDIGTGKEQPETVEDTGNRAERIASAEISNAMKANRLIDKNENRADPLKGGWLSALNAEQSDQARRIMFGEKVPGAGAAVQAVAATMRRIMDRAYTAAVEAGLDMGYVQNKGYLPRIIRAVQANLRPDEFVKRASDLYRVHFDNLTSDMESPDVLDLARVVSNRVAPMAKPSANGPFASEMQALAQALRDLKAAQRALEEAKTEAQANPSDAKAQAALAEAKTDLKTATAAHDTARTDLLAAIRDPFATTSADKWLDRIRLGNGASFDGIGPDSDFKNTRELPPEAEEIMGDFYESDPIHLVLGYVRDTARRTTYQERLGVPSVTENTRLDDIMKRGPVKAAISNNPAKYNPQTPAGRLNILHDLADPRTDNLLEMALHEALKAGADGADLRSVREISHLVTNTLPGTSAYPVFHRITSIAHTYTIITLLPRTAWTAVVEPIGMLLKTGDVKTSLLTLGFYLREAVRGAKSVRELQALSEMIGLVASPLHDSLLMARVAGGSVDSGALGAVLLGKFARANFLTQFTNAQRRASLAGGFFMVRDWAKTYQTLSGDTSPEGRAKLKTLKGDMADLAVPEADMDAFMAWMAARPGMMTVDDLNTPQGKQAAASLLRFVGQTITDPSRADKPPLSLTHYGRVVWALTSFNYAFFRNMVSGRVNRQTRKWENMRGEGIGFGKAALAQAGDLTTTFVAGFGAIVVAQMLVGAARSFIFNNAQWEQHGDDKDRFHWLLMNAISRAGMWGASDMLVQSLTGLRYERDLTSLTAGPGVGSFLSQVQSMWAGLPKMDFGIIQTGTRNSDNNTNAEHKAMKALYNAIIAPTLSSLLSLAPTPGPVAAGARGAALQYGSSQSMADNFADLFFPEKPK